MNTKPQIKHMTTKLLYLLPSSEDVNVTKKNLNLRAVIILNLTVGFGAYEINKHLLV